MNEYYNNHYITTDPEGRITYGWSTGPLPGRDTSGAVLLTDQGGYQFRLTPGGEENPPLYTEDGIPLYRCDGPVTAALDKLEKHLNQAAHEEDS